MESHSNYTNIPDEIADIHMHFEHFKDNLETEFKYLKKATAHNLFTNLTLQQAYTSTQGAHVKNIYTKLSEIQQQIQ